MTTLRPGAASVPIPNGLWVTGGYDGDKRLNSTEFVYFNGTSSTGPPLPEPRYGHCLLQHKKTLLLIGGWNENGDETSTVWIFRDGKSIEYIGNGPKMNFVRAYFSCGIFQSSAHNGHPILVVAGGSRLESGSKTSEYWDFTVPGSQWKQTSKSKYTENI